MLPCNSSALVLFSAGKENCLFLVCTQNADFRAKYPSRRRDKMFGIVYI